MIITDFSIAPAICVPGDEMTLSFTVKCERGDTVNGLTVWMTVPGAGEYICHSDADWRISAGGSRSMQLRFPAPDGSSIQALLAESRAIAVENIGIQFGIYGTRQNAACAIRLLDAWYRPSVERLALERCTGGAADDEGESLLADMLLACGPAAKTENMQVRLYFARNAAADTACEYLDLSGSMDALLAGVQDSADLVPGIYGKEADWNFLLWFGDAYEAAAAPFHLSRAFANVHLSGRSTGGVCFGAFCTALEDAPKLESHYPAYFYGGIARLGPEWTMLEPLAGTTPAARGGGALRCRRVENRCIIDGSVLVKPGSSDLVLAQLPEGFAPPVSVYAMNPVEGYRIAKLCVPGAQEENAGTLVLNWVALLSNGSLYTAGELWVQCAMEYWLN